MSTPVQQRRNGDRRYCWRFRLSNWQFVLGVNLMGAVHGVRAFLPRMLSRAAPATW